MLASAYNIDTRWIYMFRCLSKYEYFLKSFTFCDITLWNSLKSKLHILLPCRWRRYVRSKRPLTYNGLHGVISHKIDLLITTAVRLRLLCEYLTVCYAKRRDLSKPGACVYTHMWGKRDKVIPVQAVEALRFARGWGSQMAARLSALLPGRFLPPERFLVLLFVRGWVDPGTIVGLKGLGQLKKPTTSGT
jgi:hypothetical protein